MNKLLCFVDKEGEPQHSFIDGMLAKRMSDEFDVTIYTSWNKLKDIRSTRYHNAKLCAYLFPRRGVFRLINIFLVCFICLFKSLSNPKVKIISFCRNEPSFLFGSYLVSFLSNFSYVFQSSFPHEDVSGGLKGKLAKVIFNICGSRVKKITAVSEEGLARMAKYFTCADGLVIPLMGDEVVDAPNDNVLDHIRFIYIGTLDKTREFEVVINSFLKVATKENRNFTLDVYGGTQEEWNSIVHKTQLNNLSNYNSNISYKGKVIRDKLFEIVTQYDVGISLVPKNEITSEMSPTKLSEYMACGLAVLASNTVTSQVSIVNQAKSGILADFTEEDIKNGVEWFLDNPEKLNGLKSHGLEYITNRFTYSSIKDNFSSFLTK